MGRIEQVESIGMNKYNRILQENSPRRQLFADYCWRDYVTVGFIEIDVPEGASTRRRTAEEVEKEITERFGEGDYIYATCASKRRKGQFLVMRLSLLEKKVE